MEMSVFLAFISSLIISMALIPPLIKSAGWFQIMDLPGERKMHAVPIARVGGIAFAVGTFVSVLIWNPKDPLILAYLMGALIILFFGVWDDWSALNFKTKFLTQTFAALLVVVYGKVRLTTLPFFDGIIPSLWFTVPFTVIGLLGITNAINLSDGLDGLAGGLSLISFGGLAFLAYLSGDNTVLGVVIPVLGGIFGFLRFNTYPAMVFMGDGGSQFLGFSLGVLSFILTDSVRGPYSPLIALFIVGLPILDTIGVMLQRQREGRSLFSADRNHFHHKLLNAGLFHHEAVILIYLIQALMVTLASFLRFQDDGILLAVYAGLASLFFLTFFKFQKISLIRKEEEPPTRLYGSIISLKAMLLLTHLPQKLLAVIIPLFLAAIVFVPRDVPVDFGSAALGLLGFLILAVLVYRKGLVFWVRLGLYIGGAFGIYLSEKAYDALPFPLYLIMILFYFVLTALLILTIWTNKKEIFQTTPLDYLILFIVLILSLMMKIEAGGITLGLLAAKLILFFYSCEFLLNQFSNRLGVLAGVSIWALAVIGIRGWLS